MGSASLESREWHAARREQTPQRFSAEAAQHLSSRPEVRQEPQPASHAPDVAAKSTPADGKGLYVVKSNETIADVARSTLATRGVSRPDETSVYNEMKRIATLSGVAIQDVRPGMPLKGVPANLQSIRFVDADNQTPRPVPGALSVNLSGQHLVGKESMRSVAYNALRRRGAPHDNEAQIWREMNRIAYVNQDAYPQLLVNPRQVRTGMVLDIADPHKRIGPAADRIWDRDRVMEPGERTVITTRGNSIVAGEGNKVVVNRDARAYLLANSYGFLRDGQATAYAGSNVITIGRGSLTTYPNARVRHYGDGSQGGSG
jgi:hypothetical protein